MAIELLRHVPTTNFLIVEKNSGLGGTWYENRYPGCACDIRSALYSLSFEQRGNWTRDYPTQEEILKYLDEVSSKWNLQRHIRFDSTVHKAQWDNHQLQLRVHVSTGDLESSMQPQYQLTTDFLISAAGQLNIPRYPDIPGLGSFVGKQMHSARWDSTYDVAGKRIAVIGNGASAIQVVPELSKTASRLTVYQRSPKWIIPRQDRSIGRLEELLLTWVPPVRWFKRGVLMRIRESLHAYITNPDYSPSQIEWIVRWMKSQLPDKPDLWDTLTPRYPFGCNRILLSDDYYPVLNHKHVDLETRPIRRITATGIQVEKEEAQPFDLIVLATGFHTVDFLFSMDIYGLDDRPLRDLWKAGARAYREVVAEDLPNFGLLYGPNTNLGHNSVIHMIEAQSRYLGKLITAAVEARLHGQTLALRIRPDVLRAYNEQLQNLLSETSWADARCSSWYKTEDGRNVHNWPKNVGQYQAELAQIQWDDFIVEGSAATSVRKLADRASDRVRWCWMSLVAIGVTLATIIMGVRSRVTLAARVRQYESQGEGATASWGPPMRRRLEAPPGDLRPEFRSRTKDSLNITVDRNL
ncbi:flavin-containing monooxygenase [Aspergillus aculeatinus CBS 121060]|uniref:FAD/NAD(P)-binding domain-containing protein n=1 Tax=Aspergillus aculeatinus CBS 121060 TaxID=1448322 RepID=A0ACD1GZ35_9EURO|nr:FAD/NAD(P)-binding domain-containing protein [Aspergillus aculeatinus CBS 121060]RAH66736.1 FAD/NAD(P)-binding domain-containing protein [Aspergillus aculeatinus CBS 121060]